MIPTCVQCGADASDGYYDDHAGHYYCDKRCYYDWADDNFEVVAEFYRKLNVN